MTNSSFSSFRLHSLKLKRLFPAVSRKYTISIFNLFQLFGIKILLQLESEINKEIEHSHLQDGKVFFCHRLICVNKQFCWNIPWHIDSIIDMRQYEKARKNSSAFLKVQLFKFEKKQNDFSMAFDFL